MATSSIRKEFVVNDIKKFENIIKEVNKMPVRTLKSHKNSSLKKGNELLKQFSFR